MHFSYIYKLQYFHTKTLILKYMLCYNVTSTNVFKLQFLFYIFQRRKKNLFKKNFVNFLIICLWRYFFGMVLTK